MTAQSTTFSAGEVRLRCVTDDDLPVFFEHQSDPEASRMAAFSPRSRDAFAAHWARILADSTVSARTILLNGHVAGSMVSWQKEGRRLVGYWIGKSYWGRGVATRALAEFLDVVQVRPLYAFVSKQNLGSIRVLEKCGFTPCDERGETSDPPRSDVEELLFKLVAEKNEGARGSLNGAAPQQTS